ncbi:MAG: ThiF family adenylyltransferase [Candidatus Omnitrophota bacterium]|nr:ThiF family adenylyltransferase [Candidatus Omnitrophota bacterium]
MFRLTSSPIVPASLKSSFSHPEAGAFAGFEGWVRNCNEGRPVLKLEYEVFEPLCLKEAERILQEARERFSVIEAQCVHRTGVLEIGDLAVWVGVSASHRDDAFKACRYIIDEVKTRLPIWKKEFYTDGDSGWINVLTGASPAPAGDLPEARFYERQVLLPEVGASGQKKLKDARVLVVGAGGLGCPCLTSLAQAGVGTIGICEFDTLEAGNLHRQSLYNYQDIGKPKAGLAESRLRALNPFINVIVHPVRLDSSNAEKIIKDYDVLADCTDNFPAKFLLNDAALLLSKVLVQAGIYQYEGQLRVYDPVRPRGCLRCLWPRMPEPGCVGSCAETGVLGTVPNLLGHWQAMEIIKALLGFPGLSQETLIVDLTAPAVSTLKSPADPDCPLCGLAPSIKDIDEKNYSPPGATGFSLPLSAIVLREISRYRFVDVREPDECRNNPVVSVETIRYPLSQAGRTAFGFDSKYQYVVFCEKGPRSEKFVKDAREHGVKNVFALNGGASALNQLKT